MTMPYTSDVTPNGKIPRKEFYAIASITLVLGALTFLGVFFVRVGDDNLKFAGTTGAIIYLVSFVVLMAAAAVRAKRRQG